MPQLLAAVEPLEQKVGRETHRLTVELLGADETRPGVRELVQATLDLVRGLGLANTISDDRARRRAHPAPLGRRARRRTGAGMNDLLDTVLRDLAAEGDRLEAHRRRPRRGGLADADARRPGGTWLPRSPTWRGPTRSRCSAATDKEKWDEVVMHAIGDPDGFVDTRGPGRCRGGSWRDPRPLADGAGVAAGDTAGLPGRPEAAVVRPADEPDLDGDRAVHGDLGALARRGRGAGCRPRSRPTGSATWPTSGCAPATSRSACTGSSRRPRSSGSPWCRRRRRSGPGGRRTPTQTVTGPAYDFCLLVTRRRHRADTDLVAVGADADRWLDIAQAFAGPPGEGGPAVERERSDVSRPVLRVGNCSGFYGDRLTAMREMLGAAGAST